MAQNTNLELILNKDKKITFNIETTSMTLTNGKHVLNLNASQIASIYFVLDYVNTIVTDICNNKKVRLAHHLGNMVWLTMNSPYQCVNIRKWVKTDSNSLKSTEEGIYIPLPEWYLFNHYLTNLEESPTFAERIECCFFTHDSYTDLMACFDCSPPFSVY
jgi:hypothetical protein